MGDVIWGGQECIDGVVCFKLLKIFLRGYLFLSPNCLRSKEKKTDKCSETVVNEYSYPKSWINLLVFSFD